MNAPVSAFAVYKNKKLENKNKKLKSKIKKKKPLLLGPQAIATTSNDIKIKSSKSKKVKKTKEKQNVKEKLVQIKNSKRKCEKINSVNSMNEKKDKVPPLVPSTSNGFVIQNLYESATDEEAMDFKPVTSDSAEVGVNVFKKIIAPYELDKFIDDIWEKKPIHISRNKSEYYKDLISTPAIDKMLRTENILFTKNIDITSYTNGKRETHNPEGRAHPHLVWDFYLNGCSIRLLNPQTYITPLHLLNSTLQEFFNSFVGANAYLTPPDSQGFAPHYDDIEAFILQIEGKKHWRVYQPRTLNEVLPRVSSKNFDQSELGPLALEVTLEAGDLLYFPRGFIHQGVTVDGEHSLHVTISMYQKHCWADLFEKMIPAAIQMAVEEDMQLRSGLPFDIYDHFGLVNSDSNTPRRKEMEELIKNMFVKIKDYLPIDAAVDQMAKKFQQDALPPVLTDEEKAVTVFGDTDVMTENGKVINRVEMGLDTRIRLLRKNILRMVSEEESIRLYYYVENSLEYHGIEQPYLEIEEHLASAVETLITTYPEYASVENLDAPTDTEKLELADALWSRGIIMTEYPLENLDDE